MYSIHTVSSFEEISFDTLASPHTCVLIDLDDTVFVESLAVMRNANKTQRKKFLGDIVRDGGNEKIAFLYDNIKYQLVEDVLIDLLKTPGLQSIGFTAQRTGRATHAQIRDSEDVALSTLTKLNVSFDTRIIDNMSFPRMNPSNIQYKDHIIDNVTPFVISNGVVVKDGVVFCNNIDKGLVLETVIEHFNTDINTICLIDDKLKNLYSIVSACSRLGLMFVGYHYKGADLLDNSINSDAVDVQRMNIVASVPTIIPDQGAAFICQW